jgi:hypothetical protein
MEFIMRSTLRNLMSRHFCGLRIPASCALLVFAVCFISEAALASAEAAPDLVSQPDPTARARAVESYGKLPLSFEANAGQTDQQVKFLSRGSGYTLFLTSNEAVLALSKAASGKQKTQKANPALRTQVPTASSESRTPAVLRMKLVGANPAAEISGLEQLPGTSNYFVGNDPNKWRTAVPNYAKVRYQDVYPGVDLVYYGNRRQLEYDFVVAPGANPRAIKLDFTGTIGKPAKGHDHNSFLRIEHNGDLVVRLDGREVSFHKPTAYQVVSDSTKGASESTARDMVEAGYVLQANGQVGIRLAHYDVTRALTIDPILLLRYSSFLGGSSFDEGLAIAVDRSLNAYVTGDTESSDFPIVHQITGACLPSCGTGKNDDVFVTKINAAGSALVYSSYIGGSASEAAYGVAVDSSGNAYVTGFTGSSDFPIVHQIPGACLGSCGTGNNDDVFVAKINAAGSALVYSSYIGGSGYEFAQGIAVDSSGNAYVTGGTASSDFPRVHQIAGACLPSCGTGSSEDVFVTKIGLDVNGMPVLVYSSYIGGSAGDKAYGVAVDSSGNAYVTGQTNSSDFPTVNQIPGACLPSCGTGNNDDVFVTKIGLDVNGMPVLVYSSYIGGNDTDGASGIAVDSSGNAYVAGGTASSDFPRVHQIAGACLGTCGSGRGGDVIVTKINAAGSALVYSSYIGGSEGENAFGIAVDSSGNAYVTGFTASSDFPRVHQIAGACLPSCGTGSSEDVFVTKIGLDVNGMPVLVYSSYVGGSETDTAFGITVDRCGDVYLTGETDSTDFPIVHQITGACLPSCGTGNNDDVFVTKIFDVRPNACP